MNFRSGLFTLLVLVTISGTAVAQQVLPKIAKDTEYAAARKTLIAQGYQPELLADADKCEKDDPRCFPETWRCAGTGLGQCVYVWRRGQALIEIRTIGEQPIVDSVRCRANCR